MNTKLHAGTDARGRQINFFMEAEHVSNWTGAAEDFEGLFPPA